MRQSEGNEPTAGGRVPAGPIARMLLTAAGLFFVGLGVLGALLPIIPTTAPLLLAAGLFARSSPRFHRWLLNHRIFGAYIRNYREHRGMTRGHKVFTLVTLWVGVGISIYLSREALAAVIVLSLVIVGVTIHVLTLRTASSEVASGSVSTRTPDAADEGGR